MGQDQLPHEEHNHSKARRRLRRQRLGMLTYLDKRPTVIEDLDDSAEAERIVRGMLGRGQ